MAVNATSPTNSSFMNETEHEKKNYRKNKLNFFLKALVTKGGRIGGVDCLVHSFQFTVLIHTYIPICMFYLQSVNCCNTVCKMYVCMNVRTYDNALRKFVLKVHTTLYILTYIQSCEMLNNSNNGC